jgi:predicted RNase H-like HicB family nuclease
VSYEIELRGEDIMKRSFTVVVERDPESTWLVGEVVELPGCYSQAPDLRTLETNMQEAIRAYLTTVEPDEPLPDFVGTWRVEVAA